MHVIYLVLEGEVTLVLEHARRRLMADELAYVPPALARQLVNEGEVSSVVLASSASVANPSDDAELLESWDDLSPRPSTQAND